MVFNFHFFGKLKIKSSCQTIFQFFKNENWKWNDYQTVQIFFSISRLKRKSKKIHNYALGDKNTCTHTSSDNRTFVNVKIYKTKQNKWHYERNVKSVMSRDKRCLRTYIHPVTPDAIPRPVKKEEKCRVLNSSRSVISI